MQNLMPLLILCFAVLAAGLPWFLLLVFAIDAANSALTLFHQLLLTMVAPLFFPLLGWISFPLSMQHPLPQQKPTQQLTLSAMVFPLNTF